MTRQAISVLSIDVRYFRICSFLRNVLTLYDLRTSDRSIYWPGGSIFGHFEMIVISRLHQLILNLVHFEKILCEIGAHFI